MELINPWDGIIDPEDDFGDCPYLMRYESIPGHDPQAVCSYGCWDEPQCVTCVPHGGWPKFHAIVAEIQAGGV